MRRIWFSLSPGRLAGYGLIIMALSLYWRVIGFEFFDLDDCVYVIQNPYIRQGFSWANLHHILSNTDVAMWIPLTFLSYLPDYQIYGMLPAGFHITNVLLHIGNVLLLFLALRTLSGAFWRSFVVAALFAIHPLHIESVAWITERKDVLSGFCWMLVLLTYGAYVRKPAFGRYMAVVAAFALGLMAKPMVVTLPVILLLLDFWPLRRFAANGADFQSWRTLFIEKAPLLMMSAIIAGVTIYASKSTAMPGLKAWPLGMRSANALTSYAQYLRKMIWPLDLAPFYPLPVHGPPALTIAASAAVLLMISVIALYYRRQRPYMIVGWCWFIVALFPVIGFFQAGMQSMADRFVYLPMIGIYIMLVWGLAEVYKAIQSRWLKNGFRIAAVALMLAFFSISVWQLSFWKNTETLYKRALAVTHDNYVIHSFLGGLYLKDGKHAAATRQYRRVLAINGNNEDAIVGLGQIEMVKAKPEAAIALYSNYLKRVPGALKVRQALASVLLTRGRYREAIANLRKVIERKPKNEGAHVALGNALSKEDGDNAAKRYFKALLTAHPDFCGVRFALGTILEGEKNLPAAMVQYRMTTQNNVFFELGYLYYGRLLKKTATIDKAVAYLNDVLDNYRGFSRIHNYLGMICYQQKDFKGALGHMKQALRIDPHYVKADINIGSIYEAMGYNRMALFHYSEALDKMAYTRHVEIGPAVAGAGKVQDTIGQMEHALSLDSDVIDHRTFLEQAINRLKNQRISNSVFQESR